MSQTPSTTTTTSSNLKAIFDDSIKEYEKNTKTDLLTHPLMAQLQTCSSPTEILAVLRTQVQQFEQSTSDDNKLTKWLKPTINVLYAFSSTVGAGVGHVKSIWTIHHNQIFDIAFLGILTCKCHLCWCRCSSFGSCCHDHRFQIDLMPIPSRRQRTLLPATMR